MMTTVTMMIFIVGMLFLCQRYPLRLVHSMHMHVMHVVHLRRGGSSLLPHFVSMRLLFWLVVIVVLVFG
jgi:hypothetical protein